LKEVEHKMPNRYSSLLNAFSDLIKMVIAIEQKCSNEDSVQPQIARELCNWLEGLPKYTTGVFDLLRHLCEVSIRNECFVTYFETFKFIVRLMSLMVHCLFVTIEFNRRKPTMPSLFFKGQSCRSTRFYQITWISIRWLEGKMASS